MKNVEHPPIIRTNRLLLRQWSNADLEPFACMNADLKVREYFPGLQTREESDASVSLISNHIEKFGWGLWAASLAETGEFIGFIGLNNVPLQVKFVPAVEIGWRLAFKYWEKGYATEGALACLRYGFETLKLNEIVSYASAENARSRAVMQKIGMHRESEDDFNHPNLPEGHPLRLHVLYRLERDEWRNQQRTL
jgi:3-dehydroquinate dehydratase/shikimate dehydrogenase